MDSLTILMLCINLAIDIFVGLVIFVVTRKIARNQQRRDEESKAHHESKQKLELLHLKLVNAGNSLSYAVAMAVKRGTPNGEIEAGIKRYKDAKRAYFDYLTEVGLTHFDTEEDL